MAMLLRTEHPHVRRDDKGRPVLGAAGLDVHVLAGYWRLGWTLDELATAYPFLSMSEILDGLSYYLDHENEIEALIQANRPPQVPPSDG